MSKYIEQSGYFKASSVFDADQVFIFVLGGRGTGKTYGCTKWLAEHCTEKSKFIFMRRTDAEIQFVNAGNIYAEHSPNIEIDTKHGKPVKVVRGEECIGYHLALSTIHSIRGFSMLDVDYILFDEFIAERGTVIRRYAGEQMLNAYETINRNRELQGEKPVKCVFLSNFNTAESDIMDAFGFEDELYTYGNSKPLGIYTDDVKKLVMINESVISERKKRTALYQATSNEEFKNMAIRNDGVLELMPLKHYSREAYQYIGTIGNININKLWSGYYYLTESSEPGEITKKNTLRYMVVYHAYLLGNVYASSNYIAQMFVSIYED